MRAKVTKYLAVAKIVDPIAVSALAGFYGQSHNGAIYVEVPELGFIGANLLYCRYGLSIPYISVAIGNKLWVEPTISPNERWIYTGFADCQDVAPGSLDRLTIPLAAGTFAIDFGGGVIFEGDGVLKTFKLTVGSLTIDAVGTTKELNIAGAGTIDVLASGSVQINGTALEVLP